MHPYPPTRSLKDYLLPFLIIVALGAVVILSIQLWGANREDNGSTLVGLPGKASMVDLTGQVEVFLPAVDAWKIVDASATLASGEKIRTGNESQAILKFEEGSTLTLDSSSELGIEELQNSLTKKSVILTLDRGSAWVELGTEASSNVVIGSDLLKIKNGNGKLLFTVTDSDTIASAVTGSFAATVLDPQNKRQPEIKELKVPTDSSITISIRRINLLRIGGEIELVKPIDSELRKSKFFIAMNGEAPSTTDTTSTDEAATTDATTPPATTDTSTTPATTDTTTITTTLTAPVVTTSSGKIVATKSPVVVEGTVSKDTAKLEVTYNKEPYLLSKYEAGATKWTYYANSDFGNLKQGLNTYSIVAISDAGKRSPATTFTIDFAPPTADSTTDSADSTDNSGGGLSGTVTTDGVPTVGAATFGAPVLTSHKDGDTVTTAPIKISGTTSADTVAIYVYDYKLSAYTPGSTTWSFNASPAIDNLDVGENEFKVVAEDSTGKKAELVFKLKYAPAE